MLFLIAIVLAAAFAWLCAKPLKARPLPFYISAAVVTVLMIVIDRMHLALPAFVSSYVIAVFTHGALAAALWCVVAWMGALPNGTAAIKHLMPVRGELSIFAAIVTLSHAVTYSITYLQRLFSGNANAELTFVLTCIVSLALMLIMIPLTVMSFKAVRRKIKPKTWKAIQRAAYVFYALIYVHILVIFIPRARMGREGALLSILVYTAVCVGYAVMRVRKLIVMKKKPASRAALNGVCAACFAVIACGLGFASRPVNVPVRSAELSKETTAPAVETTAPAAETTAPLPTETEIGSAPASETLEAAQTSAISGTTAMTETTAVTTAGTETAPAGTTVLQTETAAETALAEAPATVAPAEEAPAAEVPAEQPPAAEPAPEAEPEAPAVPETVYNNGTYHVDIFGYDAYEHFDITIENDTITAIEGTCDESDPWYFDTALPTIRGAIIAANSPDVPDAVSGATISSDCIKQAVRQALEQARK